MKEEPAFDNQENYERSYQSMWQEIYGLRDGRDDLQKRVDACADLLLRLRDEIEAGLGLRVDTLNAFNAATRRTGEGFSMWRVGIDSPEDPPCTP